MVSIRYFTVFLSIVLALTVEMAVVLLATITPEHTWLHRIWVMMGGHLPQGMIQMFTYFLFFYGLFELQQMSKKVSREREAFDLQILPEQEQYVLAPEDVAKIKLKAIEVGKKSSYQLVELIKKACTKFRANHSVSETMDIVSKSSSIIERNSESEQSMVHYIAWAIPSVGFIGTVIGIASSMSAAGNAVSQDGIEQVTALLNIAFDTTLVALFLSLILMYWIHNVQGRLENFHAQLEEYVIENLVNRIYSA